MSITQSVVVLLRNVLSVSLMLFACFRTAWGYRGVPVDARGTLNHTVCELSEFYLFFVPRRDDFGGKISNKEHLIGKNRAHR